MAYFPMLKRSAEETLGNDEKRRIVRFRLASTFFREKLPYLNGPVDDDRKADQDDDPADDRIVHTEV